jgi:hypothetical protein
MLCNERSIPAICSFIAFCTAETTETARVSKVSLKAAKQLAHF